MRSSSNERCESHRSARTTESMSSHSRPFLSPTENSGCSSSGLSSRLRGLTHEENSTSVSEKGSVSEKWKELLLLSESCLKSGSATDRNLERARRLE